MLRAYELRPEDYRLRYSEFVAKKSGLFDKWVSSHQVEPYTELRELLILQDIKNGLPVSLRTHLEDRNIKTIEDAGIAADDCFNSQSSGSTG